MDTISVKTGNLNIDDLITNSFNAIINMVVKGDHSPFNEMMKKTKDVDIDYFEKTYRGVYTLSDELNLELKDKVVDAFSKMADSYYKDSDFESNIISLIQNNAESIRNGQGASAQDSFLNGMAKKLKEYVNSDPMYVGLPKYSNEDIEALHDDAKHITLKEFFTGGNGQDILDFYNALMENTCWTCRDLVVDRTKAFLLMLAGETVAMIPGTAG